MRGMHPTTTMSFCRPASARTTVRLAAAALLMLLAACGGGGGDGTDATQTGTAPAAANDTVTAATPASVPAAASCGITDFAAAALASINQRRAAGASCGSLGNFASAAPLRWNALLAQAAAAHSADMAALDYFSHTSADGRSMSDRINATGYAWAGLGENIAAGYPDIASVVDGWMHSDGHCANLMNPAFDEVGLACAPGAAGSRYAQYWTQDLARAR